MDESSDRRRHVRAFFRAFPKNANRTTGWSANMARSSWREFYLVQDELRRWTEDEVDSAEAMLGVELPAGYRECVTTLGDGVISDVIRVFSPTELVDQQEFFRQVHERAWWFDEPDDLTQQYALECTFVADSDGDHVVFHAGSGKMHVLPRDAEKTYTVGTDLLDVVAWWLDSGTFWRPRPFRFFDSFVGPVEAANGRAEATTLTHIADSIRSLGLHDKEVTNVGEDGRTQDVTFFIKRIGGLLDINDTSAAGVDVHFRYLTDRAEDSRDRLEEAATAAGVAFGPRWSMTPGT